MLITVITIPNLSAFVNILIVNTLLKCDYFPVNANILRDVGMISILLPGVGSIHESTVLKNRFPILCLTGSSKCPYGFVLFQHFRRERRSRRSARLCTIFREGKPLPYDEFFKFCVGEGSPFPQTNSKSHLQQKSSLTAAFFYFFIGFLLRCNNISSLSIALSNISARTIVSARVAAVKSTGF